MISGAPKQFTEHHYALDIHQLKRRGALKPNRKLTWKLGPNSLEIKVGEKGLLVNGRPIRLAHSKMHFGGTRPWLVCPDCSQRKGILYLNSLSCRTCQKLTYGYRHEISSDSAKRQAEKLRARLEWSDNLLEPDGSKPKWMRWPTFHKLVARHAELKRRWMERYL